MGQHLVVWLVLEHIAHTSFDVYPYMLLEAIALMIMSIFLSSAIICAATFP